MATEMIPEEQLEKLEKLADVLEGLEDVGDMKIRVNARIATKRIEALLAALEPLETSLTRLLAAWMSGRN